MGKIHIDYLTVLIVIGITGMLVLAIGVIAFVLLYQKRVIQHQAELARVEEEKQRDLISAFIKGEETERRRIASELHDDVGATLSAALLLIANLSKGTNRDIALELGNMIKGTLNNIRKLSHQLHPAIVNHLGLDATLKSFTDSLNLSAAVSISYNPGIHPIPLSEDQQLTIYRILQELFNNLLKHAHPSVISLSFEVESHAVKWLLSHDGKGLTQQKFEEYLKTGSSVGLKSIVQRLQTMEASISFAMDNEYTYKTIIAVPRKIDDYGTN